MPLSKARDRERKRLERQAASLAHHALTIRREKDRARLEKLLSPPQTSKPVQPITPSFSIDDIAEFVDEASEDMCVLEEEALDPINNPSQFLPPDRDADGNVIPEY